MIFCFAVFHILLYFLLKFIPECVQSRKKISLSNLVYLFSPKFRLCINERYLKFNTSSFPLTQISKLNHDLCQLPYRMHFQSRHFPHPQNSSDLHPSFRQENTPTLTTCNHYDLLLHVFLTFPNRAVISQPARTIDQEWISPSLTISSHFAFIFLFIDHHHSLSLTLRECVQLSLSPAGKTHSTYNLFYIQPPPGQGKKLTDKGLAPSWTLLSSESAVDSVGRGKQT